MVVFHQGVFHHCGLSSGWSLMKVVFHWSGLSSGWLFRRRIFHPGGLTSRWSFTWVVFRPGGLSSGWSFFQVVFHQSGLSSGWSVMVVVSHPGGLTSTWSFIRVVFPQGCTVPYCSHILHTQNSYLGFNSSVGCSSLSLSSWLLSASVVRRKCRAAPISCTVTTHGWLSSLFVIWNHSEWTQKCKYLSK